MLVKSDWPASLVSFSYDDKGITVNQGKYPTLVMEWERGVTLDTYPDKRIDSGKEFDNQRACKSWIATVRELQHATIAHGDLEHKNILVQPSGRFRLGCRHRRHAQLDQVTRLGAVLVQAFGRSGPMAMVTAREWARATARSRRVV